jgi:hypothetical protein
VVDTSDLTPEEAAERILVHLRRMAFIKPDGSGAESN